MWVIASDGNFLCVGAGVGYRGNGMCDLVRLMLVVVYVCIDVSDGGCGMCQLVQAMVAVMMCWCQCK